MTWNYRILKYEIKSVRPEVNYIRYALHEVYYDKKGVPNSWSENSISFTYDFCLPDEKGLDTPEEIVRSLELALATAKKYTILEVIDNKLVDTGVKIDYCSKKEEEKTESFEDIIEDCIEKGIVTVEKNIKKCSLCGGPRYWRKPEEPEYEYDEVCVFCRDEINIVDREEYIDKYVKEGIIKDKNEAVKLIRNQIKEHINKYGRPRESKK